MKKHRLYLLAFSVFALAFVSVVVQSGAGRLLAQEEDLTTWTSSAGTTIEADFVRLTDDGVILKLKSDGRQAEVPFSKLSLESHLQAIRMGNPEEFSKPLVKAEIKPAIEIPPLREINVDSILVSPFTSSQSLQEFVDTASSELESGNFFVLWHALPEKMQQDIEQLIVKSMEKVGSGPVVQVRTLIQNLNTIATEKEEFIFANPVLAANKTAVEDLKAKWPAIQQFLTSISDEALWQSENFETGKVERWLASLLAALGSNQDAFRAISEAETPGKQQQGWADLVTVVAASGDKGQIQISNPAIPLPPDEKLTVRKVRGQWVIVKFMKDMRTALDAALANIDKVDAQGLSTGIQTSMTAVIPPIGALARAETQEEFDEVIATLEPVIKGFMAKIPSNVTAEMSAAAGPGNAGRPGRGGAGAGQRGGGGQERGLQGLGRGVRR